MKKFIFFISFIAGFSFFSFAQGNYSKWNGKTWEQLDGNGKMVQLTPSVSPFSTIESNNIDIQLNVEAGARESVHVSIDDNLKEFFRCTQEGNTIKLSMDLSGGKYPRWLSTSHIIVTIKAPAVETLVNKGNSEVKINIQDQPLFNLFADGNPEITLTGKVTALHLKSTGNGDINAGSLLAEKIFLSTNGNSDITVNAKELVEESVKGNNEISNLFYNLKKEEPVEENSNETTALSFSSFGIKNNSLLPAKVSLISYRPDEKGNGTVIFTLIPLGRKSFTFPVGTKIYLADSEQVNTVMSGKKITDQKPFLVVKNEDDGKSFDIK